MMQNIKATMVIHWMQPFVLMFFAMPHVHGCYSRKDVYETDPRKLAPNDQPPRMLGWEQMILMFEGPNAVNQTMNAYGLTERGSMCKFEFKLGPVFKPGAGIAPTHGGFLMCGIDNDADSSMFGVFSCCYWTNRRYAIMNHTCSHIPSYFNEMYNNEWEGKLILATDNVLEQYQNTMYAFFQGTGEVYVGGIIWSMEGNWIINWVKINTETQNPKVNPNWPEKDPCIVVIGTDMFMIGGSTTDGNKTDKTYGFRLNRTGTWFEVVDYLTTRRSGASCLADKMTKDIFTIGGNEGDKATVEIGRYQSHMDHVHDRFIGYHVKDENCRQQNFPENSTECFHIKMENGTFDNISRMYAFQLDNDDGVAYQTVVIGKHKYSKFKVEEDNESSREEEDTLLKPISTSRIHMDKELQFQMKKNHSADFYKDLQHIGDDNFYAVPLKTIGFRPCVPQVSFRKHGKLVLQNPDDEGYYSGYWWDKDKQTQLSEKPTLVNDTHEYYYYLHKDYYDS